MKMLRKVLKKCRTLRKMLCGEFFGGEWEGGGQLTSIFFCGGREGAKYFLLVIY